MGSNSDIYIKVYITSTSKDRCDTIKIIVIVNTETNTEETSMLQDLVYLTVGVASVVLGALCPIPACGAIGIAVGVLTGGIYATKLVGGI